MVSSKKFLTRLEMRCELFTNTSRQIYGASTFLVVGLEHLTYYALAGSMGEFRHPHSSAMKLLQQAAVVGCLDARSEH
jgi:hypothetical protein